MNKIRAKPVKTFGKNEETEIILKVTPEDQPLYNALLAKFNSTKEPFESHVEKKIMPNSKIPSSIIKTKGHERDGFNFMGWKICKLGQDSDNDCTKNYREIMLCSLPHGSPDPCSKHKVKHKTNLNFFTSNLQPKYTTEYRSAFRKCHERKTRRKPSSKQQLIDTDDRERGHDVSHSSGQAGQEKLTNFRSFKQYPESLEGQTFHSTYARDFRGKEPRTFIQNGDQKHRSPFVKGTKNPEEPVRCTALNMRPAIADTTYRTMYKRYPFYHRPSCIRKPFVTLNPRSKVREPSQLKHPQQKFDALSMYQDSYKPFKRMNHPKQVLQKDTTNPSVLTEARLPTSTYKSHFRMFSIEAARVNPANSTKPVENMIFPIRTKLPDKSEYKKSFKGNPGQPAVNMGPLLKYEKKRPVMSSETEYTDRFVHLSDKWMKSQPCPRCQELKLIPAFICGSDVLQEKDKLRNLEAT